MDKFMNKSMFFNNPPNTITPTELYNESKIGEYTYIADKSINKIPISWNGEITPSVQKTMIVGQFNKDTNKFPLFQIEARTPYKVQYMVNQYGGHNTKFGTNMGT